MSRSHWLPVAAAIGIALATGTYAQPVSDDEAGQPGATEAQESVPSEITVTLPPALEGQIERIAGTLEAIEDDPYAAAEQERAQRDLDAQQGMAQWARYMFWAAVAQTVLSLGGLGALLYTIGLNRRATYAAVETVKVMRDAERPYLVPYKVRLKNFGDAARDQNGGDRVVELHFSFDNLGRTVAFLNSLGITYEICHEGRQGNIKPTVHDGFGRTPIRGEATLTHDVPIEAFMIDPIDMMELKANRKALYVYGFFRYADMFGAIRRTGFIFEMIVDLATAEGCHLVPCTPHPYWFDEEEKPDAD